jgi:hypothetical protein
MSYRYNGAEEMKVFAHHLYEYKKGLRRLVLYTAKIEYEQLIIAKLRRRNIPYIISRISAKKINVFFGKQYCIDVLKSFPHLDLTTLSPDKDYILGSMLGYDMKMHCRRYLKNISTTEKQQKIKICFQSKIRENIL